MKNFLHKYPVFTHQELVQYFEADGKDNSNTRNNLLQYYKKNGRVGSIRRGVYYVRPPQYQGSEFLVDPFLVASKIVPDSVLAYHSALMFYGKNYHESREHYCLTGSRPQTISFQNGIYRLIKFAPNLKAAADKHFLISEEYHLGIPIKVCALERTLVDVMDKPQYCLGWEEVWRSLEQVSFFNFDKVTAYTVMLGKKLTASRVGYFLEQHREEMMVPEKILESLEKLSLRKPMYFDSRLKKGGHLNKRWNLIVPDVIRHKSWVEPQ